MQEIIPYVIPLYIVAMWPLILFILSKTGGWSHLSDYYTCQEDFKGTKWSMQSLKIGRVRYRNSITIGANANALYLSVFFLFRLWHKPLEIPFSDLSGKLETGMFVDYVNLTTKNGQIDIRLHKQQAEKLEKISDWHYER